MKAFVIAGAAIVALSAPVQAADLKIALIHGRTGPLALAPRGTTTRSRRATDRSSRRTVTAICAVHPPVSPHGTDPA